jgi:sec-independent protein translocase protein TatA
MFGLGPWEIGLILVALLLVLGPSRLPEMARSLAKGIKEFKKATTETEEPPQQVQSSSQPDDTPPRA